jgi:hypothetical protein
MRTVRELAPLGIVLAFVGTGTWYLLEQGVGAGAWLLAGLLVAHGFIHVMFLVPTPAAAGGTARGPSWPFDLDRSWLVRSHAVDRTLVRTLGTLLIGWTCSAALLAASATVGVVVPVSWWPTLVLATAAASTLLLALDWSPGLSLGLAIDLALMWLALASGWIPSD